MVIPCLAVLFVAAAYLTGPQQPPYNSQPHPPKDERSRNGDAPKENYLPDQQQ